MTHFIELSHKIKDGMLTYTGLPGPVIRDYLSREASREHYAPGTTFQIGKIDMVLSFLPSRLRLKGWGLFRCGHLRS